MVHACRQGRIAVSTLPDTHGWRPLFNHLIGECQLVNVIQLGLAEIHLRCLAFLFQCSRLVAQVCPF